MKEINYSYFRNHLSSVLNDVNDNHTPILITRQKQKPAVVISLDDYNTYQETMYLMSSNKNRKRLNSSVQDIESNNVIKKHIIE